MLWVVAPLLHRYPEADEDVSITLPPGQKVSGPPAVIVGITEIITTTGVEADVAPQLPEDVTLKLPDAVTVILLVVAPLLHKYPSATDDVSMTLPP